MCKSHKYFLVHEDTFQSIVSSKKFPEKSWPKIYIGQDPDPDPELDVFGSRIRIRSKIVRICKTGFHIEFLNFCAVVCHS
jgi:hypothetical protein